MELGHSCSSLVRPFHPVSNSTSDVICPTSQFSWLGKRSFMDSPPVPILIACMAGLTLHSPFPCVTPASYGSCIMSDLPYQISPSDRDTDSYSTRTPPTRITQRTTPRPRFNSPHTSEPGRLQNLQIRQTLKLPSNRTSGTLRTMESDSAKPMGYSMPIRGITRDCSLRSQLTKRPLRRE